VATPGREGENARIAIQQEPSTGISLLVDGQPVLRLVVEYHCAWDHAQRFLAVDTSSVKVMAVEVNEPLFRYEYVRSHSADIPSAHIQVHGHRDALTFIMAVCGRSSARGKRRSKEADRGVVPKMHALHFPVGGARFRPCLEDVLQMLVTEIGVDAPDGALDALADGRERWRLDQLAASVRDSPETAARVLREELGYEVRLPDAGPRSDRPERLREL
jgi:hypothetical protein